MFLKNSFHQWFNDPLIIPFYGVNLNSFFYGPFCHVLLLIFLFYFLNKKIHSNKYKHEYTTQEFLGPNINLGLPGRATMPTHELRRPFKRPLISDQQKRRELSLLRQQQNRLDAQFQARRLASTLLSLSHAQTQTETPSASVPSSVPEPEPIEVDSSIGDVEEQQSRGDITDVRQASKLRGSEARRWFARQLMLPEWMIDIPDRLSRDW